MKKLIFSTLLLLVFNISYSQSWQDVGGGTNGSSHGLLTYNGELVDLGSFNNNPCNRVASWDGGNWSCFNGGVGIVARAGVVWNGDLVVVGDFWNNFQPCVGCNGLAVWDGSAWTPLDQGFNNDVLTVTVYNGDLIVGGDFTEANGVPCSRVVRWNTTTSTFESLGTPTSFDNDVRCMTVFNGELYVGGDFNNVDGNPPSDGLVKWDDTNQLWLGGNTGVDLVGGVNETVRVLYVNPNDGNLYMGGHFPELIDGDSINPDFNMSGVAMYDGSNWFPLGTGLNDYCRAMHEYNGNLIVGGYFTTADGVSCNRVAKWNPSTQTFSPLGLGFDGSGIDEYVKSMEVWNGILFAGGAYTQAEGNTMNYIAQWYEAPTAAPTAAINPSSSNECEGGCINFTDISSSNPTSWTWTFPGSSTPSSSVQHPTNICYPNGGNYFAKLVACNSNGCDSTTVNITINSVPVVTSTPIITCDSVSYNSMMYYTSTMVNDTTFGGSFNGCDSITNQQITINNSVVVNQPSIVGCDSVSYNSMMYYTSTMVNDTTFGGSFNGCDSITNQQITINNSLVTNQPPIVACDSALVYGVWYFTSQTVSDYYPNGSFSGCDSTDNTPVTINTVDASTTTNNDTITANAGGATYQWLDCNNSYAIISGETAQLFIASSNGSYAVQVTQNGCTDTSACEIIITTGINENNNNIQSIHPNPTNGLVHIQLRASKNTFYSVLSLDGRIILEKQQLNDDHFTVDLKNESKGIYLLKVEYAQSVQVFKIVKQ